MKIMIMTGGFGHPATGTPATGTPVSGLVGMHAWRVRPTLGATYVLSGQPVTDVPPTKPNKPPHASASERCP